MTVGRSRPAVTTVVVGRHAKSATRLRGAHPGLRGSSSTRSYGTRRRPTTSRCSSSSAPRRRRSRSRSPAPAEEALWAPGSGGRRSSAGATSSEGGGGSDVLKEAQVPIVADADCEKAYARRASTPPSMVCAGYPRGRHRHLPGRLGRPDGRRHGRRRWRQVGVTSWGDGCARPEKFGVYARVAGATAAGVGRRVTRPRRSRPRRPRLRPAPRRPRRQRSRHRAGVRPLDGTARTVSAARRGDDEGGEAEGACVEPQAAPRAPSAAPLRCAPAAKRARQAPH